MKIILTDIQYNTLKEMTEESLRNFLYKLWDTQKKRGEDPSLDDIIYQVTEIDRDTREDYSTIRPIWYRYNGGFSKLFKKLKDEILNKTFDLVVPEIGLNTKIKVIELESVVGGLHYFNEMVDIFCNVDNQGVIDFYMFDDETDEEIMVNDTIDGAYMEALSAYETGDLTGAINHHVYDFFYKKLEKYGIPIDTEIELVDFGDSQNINEVDEKNSNWKNVEAIKQYWKKKLKRGENITYDEDELEYWGITTVQYRAYARFAFQDLVGGEEFCEKFIKSLMNKTFSTKDFGDRIVGGYDFEWVITNVEYRDFDFFLYGKTLPGGSVSIMDGRHLTLEEALEDEDIGWEIQEEVNDVVQDCMNEIILPVTAYYVTVPVIYIAE